MDKKANDVVQKLQPDAENPNLDKTFSQANNASSHQSNKKKDDHMNDRDKMLAEKAAQTGDEAYVSSSHTPTSLPSVDAGNPPETYIYAGQRLVHSRGSDCISDPADEEGVLRFARETQASGDTRQSRRRRSRPRHRMPWSVAEGFTENFVVDEIPAQSEKHRRSSMPVNHEASFLDRPLFESKIDYIRRSESHEEQGFSPRRDFRNVNPPLVIPKKPQNISTSQSQKDKETADSSIKSASPMPRKTWSSVKFQPRISSCSSEPDQKESVAYPFTISSNKQVRSLYKVNPSNISSFSSYTKEHSGISSISLLQEPILKTYSPTAPGGRTSHSKTNPTNSLQTFHSQGSKYVFGDVTPSEIYPPLLLRKREFTEAAFTRRSQETTSPPPPPQAFRAPPSQKEALTRDKEEDESSKPRVAACLKLLNPTHADVQEKQNTNLVFSETLATAVTESENE